MTTIIVDKDADMEEIQETVKKMECRLFHYEAYLAGLTDFVAVEKDVLSAATKMLKSCGVHIGLLKTMVEEFLQLQEKKIIFSEKEYLKAKNNWDEYKVELGKSLHDVQTKWNRG